MAALDVGAEGGVVAQALVDGRPRGVVAHDAQGAAPAGLGEQARLGLVDRGVEVGAPGVVRGRHGVGALGHLAGGRVVAEREEAVDRVAQPRLQVALDERRVDAPADLLGDREDHGQLGGRVDPAGDRAAGDGGDAPERAQAQGRPQGLGGGLHGGDREAQRGDVDHVGAAVEAAAHELGQEHARRQRHLRAHEAVHEARAGGAAERQALEGVVARDGAGGEQAVVDEEVD
ncbi:MAG: hypothetical protein KF878_12540 [Planctomycetes bacterium]|nr:hypothetical protein [Planctomycetota bacterium]